MTLANTIASSCKHKGHAPTAAAAIFNMKKLEGKAKPKAPAEQVVEHLIEGEPRRYNTLKKGKLTKKEQEYERFVHAMWHIHF